MIYFAKVQKAMKKLNEKLQNLEGSDGLIHAEWSYKYKVAYPEYAISWGYNENPLEYKEKFAKALKKACTLCKNFKYNHYDIDL